MEELKKKIINLLEQNSTEVDVYSDVCIHHADETGPDEYDSSAEDISLEVNSDGTIDYIGRNVDTVQSDYRIIFNDEETFKAEKEAAEDEGSLTLENCDGLIAIVTNDCWYGFIYEPTVELNCRDISSHILDDLDASKLEFSEPDPPDPPDPWERDMMEPWC